MKIINNTYQKVLVGYLTVIVVFWAYLVCTHSVVRGDGTTPLPNYYYSFIFGLIPLIGGFVGMIRASIWGTFKSALGKAVFFISLGLLLWGLGEAVWSYYNIFRNVAVPYPSLADLGFASSIFFWVVGAFHLSKASGAKFGLKKGIGAKFGIVALLAVLVGLSYYLLVTVARGGVIVPQGESLLKLILDIAYPLGDLLAVTLGVIIFALSFKFFGGVYRVPIISILLGLVVMYIGDILFSYSTTVMTYYNADWGDLLLTFGLFFLTFGVLGFATHPAKATKAAAVNPAIVGA